MDVKQNHKQNIPELLCQISNAIYLHAFTHLTYTKTDSVLVKINKNCEMQTRNITQTCNI